MERSKASGWLAALPLASANAEGQRTPWRIQSDEADG